MSEYVDPFIGTEAIDLPAPEGIAATWFYIKAQIANNHPGATLPFAPVSVSAYSGGYPTGYGRYGPNTQGPPERIYETPCAYGAAHVQQSGTGFVKYFYNYLLTMPFRETPAVPRIDLNKTRPWKLVDQVAHAGYYRAGLAGISTTVELTVGPFAAAHRYSFGGLGSERRGLLVDLSHGGLASPRTRTRAGGIIAELRPDGGVEGSVVQYGIPWFFAVLPGVGATGASLWRAEAENPGREDILEDGWLAARELNGAESLALNDTVCKTTRAGVLWNVGDGTAGELFVGLSLDSVAAARSSAEEACRRGFNGLRSRAEDTWKKHFDRIRIEGGSRRTKRIFSTAFYHSSLKPARGERSNFLWKDGPEIWTGLATLWDQYKTQLPFLISVYPENALSLARSFRATAKALGRFPNALICTTQLADFENQSRCISVVTLYDIYRRLEVSGRIDVAEWGDILESMSGAVERQAGAVQPGSAVPGYSHLLDVSYAAGCVCKMATELGRGDCADAMAPHLDLWRDAFDEKTGMMREGEYYEAAGTHYSFRLIHDMPSRIELCGGPERFKERLDRFFGFGMSPTEQVGGPSGTMTQKIGKELGRFDGLNNEVMLETPFAYHYVGKPDRTSEIIHAIQTYQFSDTPGGIPGNDDSGALSSWYLWNAVGLFPVPGQDLFFVSRPLFDTITFGDFTIEVRRHDGDDSPQIYLESIELNGEKLSRTFVTSREVFQGGTLRIALSSEPGRLEIQERPPVLVR